METSEIVYIFIVFATLLQAGSNETTKESNFQLGKSETLDSTVSSQFVENSLRVVDFVDLSELSQEAEFVVELSQTWTDKQLATGHVRATQTQDYNVSATTPTQETNSSQGTNLVLRLDIKSAEVKLSWMPAPIQVVDYREIKYLTDNIKLSPTLGQVTRIQRVKVSTSCKMFFVLFPHDSHVCTLNFVNGAMEDLSKINETWSKAIKPICDDLQAFAFHIKGYLSLALNDKSFSIHLIASRKSNMVSHMYSPVMSLCILSFFTLTFGSFMFRICTSMACFICLIVTTSIFWRDIPHALTGSQTAIEHYFVICIGLVFQVVFSNICMYAYWSLPLSNSATQTDENTDVESNLKSNNPEHTESSISCCCNIEDDATKQKEAHILTMGKFHSVLYLKGLKPAYKNVPISFVLVNVIYWSVVLYLSSGLPKGFESPQNDCLLG